MSHHQAVEDERERLEIIREIRRIREELDIADGLLDRAKWTAWREERGYEGPVSKMDMPELVDLRDDLKTSLAELISYAYPDTEEVGNATSD